MPTTGLAVVGEQGPELLMLPGGSQIMPLAGGMSAMRGGASGSINGQPIQVTINVDGRRLAQVVAQQVPTIVRNATGTRSF